MNNSLDNVRVTARATARVTKLAAGLATAKAPGLATALAIIRASKWATTSRLAIIEAIEDRG